LAWDRAFNPTGIVIAQNLDLEDMALIQWQTMVMRKLFNTQKASTRTLLVIDEGMDFFGPTGNSLHGPIVQKCWRSGGEKGMSCLIGVQRPKSINLQMLTESNLLYLFHLRFANDVKRLQEMGLPGDISPPIEKHKFIFFKDDKLHPKKIKLAVKG